MTTSGEVTPAGAQVSAWRFLWGGAAAALAATAGNLWWFGAFSSVTGQPRPDVITPDAIILASVASVLLAAGIYLLLARALRIATPLYIVGALAVGGVTTLAPMMPVLPDGRPTPDAFAMLAMPMHVWAGVCAAVIVPLFVHLRRRVSTR